MGPRGGRFALGLALWGLAVLALHGIVLAGWPLGAGVRDAAPAPRRLHVRHVVLAAPAAPAPPEAAQQAVPLPPPAAAAPPRPRAGAAPRRAVQVPPQPPPAGAAAVSEGAEPAADAEPAEPRPPALVAATAVAVTTPVAAPMAVAADEPPPTYRTRVPPSAALRYELRRGRLSGQGTLRWQHASESYELTMEGTVFGLQVLAQRSVGGFDAAGLAPRRFLDQRRGRAVLAANFQRESGVITYSGTPAQHPLLAGAQDRLSWMVQLASIVDAEPARWRAGTQIEMAVSGARGDADVWTFTVIGHEAVELGGATRSEAALALRREPRKPYDTRVEVWLDPARHHLPVRMQLSSARADEALTFLLAP